MSWQWQLGTKAHRLQPQPSCLSQCLQKLRSCGLTHSAHDPRVQTLETQPQLRYAWQHHSFKPSCPHNALADLCLQPQPLSRQKAQEAFGASEVRSITAECHSDPFQSLKHATLYHRAFAHATDCQEGPLLTRYYILLLFRSQLKHHFLGLPPLPSLSQIL